MRKWDAILESAKARGLTQSQIAREQGCSHTNVRNAMRRRGLSPWPHRGCANWAGRKWDAILESAKARGLTQSQIAREQGCSRQNVRNAMRRRGVK